MVKFPDPLPGGEFLPDGCWEWLGYKNKKGYGQFGRTLAHRRIFLMGGHAIPDGYETDHLCMNRGCVNPYHLEAVTHGDNVRRIIHPLRPNCVNGHELTDANTYKYRNSRHCRICIREAGRKFDLAHPNRHRKLRSAS